VVFGKLADIYGRKPVIQLGIAIFLVGSILCGFAWSMPVLIGFRLIQGIGAGAVQPVALTIVADLFPGRERGKVQGYLASVWAISAVLGPIVGALIVRDYSWAWIFWMNVPLGILSALGFGLFLRENVERQRKPIDYRGALLFMIASGSLMVGLTSLAMPHWTTLSVVAIVFAVSAVMFVRCERRAADPVISFTLWSHRAIAATNGVAILGSMALMGLTSSLPIYVQGVLHRSPVVAGLALTMTMVGWPTGAFIAARSFPHIGLRRLLLFGAALIPLGALVFVALSAGSSPVLAGTGSLVMGLGMGMVSVTSLVLIQEVAEWNQRASATASNMFSRNLGSALGATLLGGVLNFKIRHFDPLRPIRFEQLERAFAVKQGNRTPLNPELRVALEHALHSTFVAMLLLAILLVLLAIIVPDVRFRNQATRD